jgi:predicted nucleic acid-binding Zn ribbon protein
MTSNEHPNMHGNPCDEPFYCEVCGKAIREEDVFVSEHDDTVLLCSDECAGTFDEKLEHE